MKDLGRIARRFPLVARPRPACLALEERVKQVGELARAARAGDGDRLALAASASNLAALIASDCGMPDLARTLCWRQFDVYMRARPLDAQSARYALEPIVNLARLHIRDGDGASAYSLLDSIYQAVRSEATVVIGDRRVSFRGFTASAEDHRTLCQWLWTVVLADGTRALAAAGRWSEALAHAEQHRGVGERLLDGRQVAILANCMAGDPAAALAVLAASALSEPWEEAVAACLNAAVAEMVEHYLGLDTAPGLVVFRTRIGLSVVDLTDGADQADVSQATTRLVDDAVTARDGYAAREVLAHNACRARLALTQERILCVIAESSGLRCGIMSAQMVADLLEAVSMSEAATVRGHPQTPLHRPVMPSKVRSILPT
jgi:hypothetical protein